MDATILERLLKLEKSFMDDKDRLEIFENIINMLRTDVTTIFSWILDNFGLNLPQHKLRSDAAAANHKSTKMSIRSKPQLRKREFRFRNSKSDNNSNDNETPIGPVREHHGSNDTKALKDAMLRTQVGNDSSLINDDDEGPPSEIATTRSITRELTKDHTPITLPGNKHKEILEHKGSLNHTEVEPEAVNVNSDKSLQATQNGPVQNPIEKAPKGTPMICDVCGKVLKGAGSLKCHKQIHSNQRPYKCLICPNKAFKMKHHLDFHILTHKGDKKWICKFCSKGFIAERDLLRHERTHTGERPFGCHLCPKSFNVKQHLTLHIRTHTGERPYKCPICEKTFTQANSLRIHKKIHSKKVLERVETGTEGIKDKGSKQ